MHFPISSNIIHSHFSLPSPFLYHSSRPKSLWVTSSLLSYMYWGSF